MKKLSTMLVVMILPMMVSAQLKVTSTGNVLVGTGSSTYPINIYGSPATGSSLPTWAAYISGFGKALRIDNVYTTTSLAEGIGVDITSQCNTSYSNYGLHSYSENVSTSSYAKAVGLYGSAKMPANGIGYGVAGTLVSGGNGACVYGGQILTSSISGIYAGYFYGNVKVTGTIDGTLVNSSDARLKEDVQPLSENAANRGAGVLDVLESLTPVSFKYKKMEEEKMDTSATHDKEAVEEEELPNPVMEKEHFGLIAQELQEVYPNLVYEKDNGYLAVNYVELVPVLMQAIKELNAKVAVLEANKVNCSPLTSGVQETLSLPLNQEQWAGSSMEQNFPNPFTEKTDIAIYLPESVREAALYIYDLSGKQLEQHPVEGRGETVMTIHADKMDAGMYVYSLIADKKVVTTKKMIVVK